MTTPEDAPEAPPVAVTQSNVLSHSVVLSWVAPRSDRQNGVIRHYIIEAYENVTGSTLTYQTPSDQATLVVSNLHPFYAYTMRILAVTVSPGPLSAPIAVHTMEDSKKSFHLRVYRDYTQCLMNTGWGGGGGGTHEVSVLHCT